MLCQIPKSVERAIHWLTECTAWSHLRFIIDTTINESTIRTVSSVIGVVEEAYTQGILNRAQRAQVTVGPLERPPIIVETYRELIEGRSPLPSREQNILRVAIFIQATFWSRKAQINNRIKPVPPVDPLPMTIDDYFVRVNVEKGVSGK